jgi:hypothetical protein
MLNKLLATVFCCASLSLPMAANSNSQINAVANTLKAVSQTDTHISKPLVALDFGMQASYARHAVSVSAQESRMQANFGLIAVALFCFAMRANRSRV